MDDHPIHKKAKIIVSAGSDDNKQLSALSPIQFRPDRSLRISPSPPVPEPNSPILKERKCGTSTYW